ncbi:MAG TPA: hypothetical protein VGK90_10480 [Rhizomicrobium sp.]|jgi:hypothetical protein
MAGRPGARRGSKSAKKSVRGKTARARTGRVATRKAAKAPAKKKAAKKAAVPARKKIVAKKPVAKKSAAKRKSAKRATKPTPRAVRKEVFGEGNYTAARDFRENETRFVRRNRNKIEKLGKDAEAALDGDEGEELEAAEEEARSHSHSPGD